MNTIDLPTEPPTQAVTIRPNESVSLFRTDDPVEVVVRATKLADALRGVIEKQGLITNIQGKKYPKCEAWTLCGTMLGVFPVLCWSKPLEDGWEARVEARTRDGQIVGAAEAECLRTEKNWSSRDDFAVRSMAQTRATAKALRMPLGFIMTLAGYEATPECEMPHDTRNSNTRQNNSGASGSTTNSRPGVSKTVAGRMENKGPSGTTAPPAGTVKPSKQPVYATTQSRMKFLHALNAAPGDSGQDMMKSFCVAASMLLDTESVIDLPLKYVPIYTKQVDWWKAAINDFENGNEAIKPCINEEGPELSSDKVIGKPHEPAPANAPSKKPDPEWFFDIICPVPRRGVKRDEYLKEPDTIGSLFESRHDDEYARKRLFGFALNFKPEGWKGNPPRADEIKFREALDAFMDWHEETKPDGEPNQ